MSCIQTIASGTLSSEPRRWSGPPNRGRALSATPQRSASGDHRLAIAVDFGSTYTKASLVDLGDGRLIASVAQPTTPDDLRGGLRQVLEQLGDADVLDDAIIVACSSAGGGLRVAVAGLEEDLTVRAGRYAAMSAGARVVRTYSGRLDPAALAEDEPDLVLLTGGLDNGDEKCLLRSAETLATSDLRVPVVIAGNAAVADQAADSLARTGISVTISPNVMPAAGVLNVGPTRARIREVFIRHVIGGRQVRGSRELRQIVRMTTPDAALLGTEILAKSWNRDVVVLDVGGATTDVHSYVRAPMARQGIRVRLRPEDAASRTVEGDLGVWSNADSLVDAAEREGLLAAERAAAIAALLPRERSGPAAQPDDLELAGMASRLAVRRHAGRLRARLTSDGIIIESQGKDLRSVSAVVGTGGVFRRADRRAGDEALRTAIRNAETERRLMPEDAISVIDHNYVLAAGGLISTINRAVAVELLTTSIEGPEGNEL
jgi:uncharacterized protein (TIGR01319 family)